MVALLVAAILSLPIGAQAPQPPLETMYPPDVVASVVAHDIVSYARSVAISEVVAYLADLEAREAQRAAEAAQAQAQPVRQVTGAWPSSLQPCGGDLPPCYVKARESGGDYNAQNPTSSASGAWQFLDSTWAGYGGYARAVYAPPSVQDAKARELWAGGAGCGHWSAC